MSTWNTSTIIATAPDDVIDLLTDPTAASRWSPVAFEAENLVGERLSAGERARLTGSLAGLRVAFDLEVHAADAERLSLSARGLIAMDVLYELSAEGDGARVDASVTVHPGRGITGRLLARATDALLAAGALHAAVARIGDDRSVFEQVQVNPVSQTIGWPGDVDLDPDVLYGRAEPASGARIQRRTVAEPAAA